MNDAELKEFASFPAELRRLVEEELAAGNAIKEFGHGHPAAPCGAYLRLSQPVTTRPREKTPTLDFYERNGSSHSGEFTVGPRHYFVLEPPLPPPPDPDMDEIREALRARCAAADADRFCHDRITEAPPHTALHRFTASMASNREKWHDGSGYDLEALHNAEPSEREAIETLLLSRGMRDWRDVEALAAFSTARAEAVLRTTFASGDESLRMAVITHAGHLLADGDIEAFLIRLLDEGGIESRLPEALLVMEDFHPAAVIEAMFRGLLQRDGVTACHLAAMLYFLHGRSSEPFDWSQRPLFLEFNTADRNAREAALKKLMAALH